MTLTLKLNIDRYDLLYVELVHESDSIIGLKFDHAQPCLLILEYLGLGRDIHRCYLNILLLDVLLFVSRLRESVETDEFGVGKFKILREI